MTDVIEVANAPCSYGAFEETIGVDPHTPAGGDVLRDVAAAGYAGIDLGPVGYLGEGLTLRARLEDRSLDLAGGYLPLTFQDHAVLDRELPGLDALLDVFDEVGGGRIPPKPTLAAAPRAAARLARQNGRPARLEREWRRFADGVARAVEVCRARGHEPTFHHHVGTWVETPAEIERLLAMTDVSLCLDTGHLAVAAGNPIESMRDWRERINHVHVKDGRRAAIDGLVDRGEPVDELWRGETFTALGDGDLECAAFLDALRAAQYSGWIVVEQDVFPARGEAAQRAREDQVRSRAYLRDRGF